MGAGNGTMLRLTVRRLFGWGLAVALVFTVAYAVGGPLLLQLLTTDAQVIAEALRYLPWAVAIPLAGMAAFVWDGIYIGTTKSRGMLLSCFWAALIFFALWLLIPGLKTVFPNPVYPEWGLALLTFFICYFADRRSVEIPAGDAEALATR